MKFSQNLRKLSLKMQNFSKILSRVSRAGAKKNNFKQDMQAAVAPCHPYGCNVNQVCVAVSM